MILCIFHPRLSHPIPDPATPLSILFPVLKRTEASAFWSSLFLSFKWSVNCILGILNFWPYQWVHTTCFYFVTRLPHSGWYLLVLAICLRISWIQLTILNQRVFVFVLWWKAFRIINIGTPNNSRVGECHCGFDLSVTSSVSIYLWVGVPFLSAEKAQSWKMCDHFMKPSLLTLRWLP